MMRCKMAAARSSPNKSLMRLLSGQGANDFELATRIRAERMLPNIVNAKGETPLHLACERGLTACVRALLDAGADASATDWRHSTPLLRAIARAGSLEIVKVLVAHGAELNPVSRAIAAPLVQAISSKRTDIARYIIK